MRKLTQLVFLSACLLATGFASMAAGDETSQSIHLEVLIADLPGEVQLKGGATAAALLQMEEAGDLEALQRIHVSTVNGQEGYVQFGGQVPLPQSRGFSRGGPQVTTYTSHSVGTMVQVTPHVEDDGRVLLAFAIERTQIEPRVRAEPDDDADTQEESLHPAGMEILNIKATVRLKPDEPTLVTGRRSTSGNKGSQTWIILTAKVEAGKPAAADEAFDSSGRPATARATAGTRRALANQADPPSSAAAEARPLLNRSESRSVAAASTHEVKVYTLQNASAASIATVLKEVFATEPVRIAADPRVNSVIVTGPRRTQDIVAPLVQRLDAQP